MEIFSDEFYIDSKIGEGTIVKLKSIWIIQKEICLRIN